MHYYEYILLDITLLNSNIILQYNILPLYYINVICEVFGSTISMQVAVGMHLPCGHWVKCAYSLCGQKDPFSFWCPSWALLCPLFLTSAGPESRRLCGASMNSAWSLYGPQRLPCPSESRQSGATGHCHQGVTTAYALGKTAHRHHFFTTSQI